LARAVVNRCLDNLELKYRKKEVNFSVMKTSDEQQFFVDDKDVSPLDRLLEKELSEEVDGAIKRLPVECQTVFVKSRLEGKSHKEIAEELSISVATVKYHVKNALLRLQEDLKFFLSHSLLA
jgi:RNA polymerase sigma-70 factor (ECF subfamily)